MIEPIFKPTPIFKRIIDGLSLAYLLLMTLYGILRLIVADGNGFGSFTAAG
jgi:hypothetical protein